MKIFIFCVLEETLSVQHGPGSKSARVSFVLPDQTQKPSNPLFQKRFNCLKNYLARLLAIFDLNVAIATQFLDWIKWSGRDCYSHICCSSATPTDHWNYSQARNIEAVGIIKTSQIEDFVYQFSNYNQNIHKTVYLNRLIFRNLEILCDYSYINCRTVRKSITNNDKAYFQKAIITQELWCANIGFHGQLVSYFQFIRLKHDHIYIYDASI